MSATSSIQQENISKIAVAEDWAKTSLKALKEMAPLAKHIPWLGAAAGTVVQLLELWDVSFLIFTFHLTHL